jgi:hypothetical protein
MRTIVLAIPGTLVMVSHVHTINTTNAMLRRTRSLLDGRLATILATTTLEDVKIPEIHLLVPLVMTDIEVMESHAWTIMSVVLWVSATAVEITLRILNVFFTALQMDTMLLVALI